MATHGDVGLSQPVASTITFKLDAIELAANGTNVLREVMVLGSPETSNALTAVLAAQPASTAWAAAVRIVSGPSSLTDLSVALASTQVVENRVLSAASTALMYVRINEVPSSAANIYQSTFTDLNCRINAPSTANAANFLPVRLTDGAAYLPGGTDYTHNSTADLTLSTVSGPMTFLRSGAAAEGSTDHTLALWGSSDGAAYVSPVDAAGVSMASSIVAPSTASGIVVRPAQPNVSGYAQSSAFQSSTEIALGTSNAASKNYVFAYSITSTVGVNYTVSFYDAQTVVWNAAVSSGFGGANLAVTPPAYLFKGTTGSSMSMHVNLAAFGGSSGVTLSVAYFTGA